MGDIGTMPQTGKIALEYIFIIGLFRENGAKNSLLLSLCKKGNNTEIPICACDVYA